MGRPARTFAYLSLAFVGLGCADETTGPTAADFDELCGVEGPVEILPLDASQTFDGTTIRLVGERYVVSLTTFPEDETGKLETEVWSVGLCGEEPLLLTDEAERFVIQLEQWPEAVFTCHGDSEQLWIHDPTGTRPTQPVFDAGDCWFSTSPEGLLSIEGGEGEASSLVFQPWPDDPWLAPAEQILLLDDVGPSFTSDRHRVLQTGEGEVLALTSEDALVAVSLVDGEVEPLAESVYEYKLSPSGRYVLWQDLEVTGGSGDWPRGQISILDRETGVATALAEASLATTLSPFVAESFGLFYLRLDFWSEPEAAVYLELPAMTPIPALATGLAPRRVIDDTRILFSGFFASSLQVIDLASGQSTALYDGPVISLGYGADGLTVLEGFDRPLRTINYEGEHRLLAREANQGYVVGPDERVFTPYAVTDGVGQLVVVEPETLDAFAIDEQVHVRYGLHVREDDEGGSIIAYPVVDPERYGIWAANPAH